MRWLERQPHALILAVLLCALFCANLGCRSPRPAPPSPQTRFNAIEAHFVAGDLGRARSEAEEAYRGTVAGDPWRARFGTELARVCVYQGLTGEALSLLVPPLPETTDTATIVRRDTLLAIALARSDRRADLARALAHARTRAGADPALMAEVEGAAGSVDLNAGRLDTAEPHFRQALAAARSAGNRFLQMQSLINLGVVALHREAFEEALADFSEAAADADAIGARVGKEKAVGNVADAYLGLGDLDRALDSFTSAAAQAKELAIPIDQIRWLQQIALCRLRLGDRVAARNAYAEALREAEKIGNSELVLESHVELAYLLLHDDPAAALAHTDVAARIASTRSNLPEQLETDLLRAMLPGQRSPAESIGTLQRVDTSPQSTPSLRWQAEQAIAGIYTALGDNAAADQWFARALETLYRQRASLRDLESRLPFLENGRELYDAFVEHLVAEGRTGEALDVLDRSRAQTLAIQLQPQRGHNSRHPVTAAVTRRSFDPQSVAGQLHATLLVYYLGPRASYLWAITGTRTGFFPLPGGASLAGLVEAHNRAILGSEDLLGGHGAAPSHALFDALVRPAQEFLTGSDRVVIVADRQLHALNFETLLTSGGDAHFWIEDVTVRNAASLRSIAHPIDSSFGTSKTSASEHRPRSPATPAPPPRMLLIGDPIYPANQYEKLPKAAEEIQGVLGHFAPGQRTVLTGAEATPAAYQRSRPEDFAFIHFVAHATASTVQPLDSAVLLSAAPGSGEVQKLYAREILSEHLQARLVTISACYSSGRRSYTGEGVVGLAWAFLRAGSQNVIGALWEVNDASTPELMDRLYAQLAVDGDPDRALRAAKLSLLHGGGVFRKPLYWAPFQLYSGGLGSS